MTLQVCGERTRPSLYPRALCLWLWFKDSSSYLEGLMLTWACISDSHQRPVVLSFFLTPVKEAVQLPPGGHRASTDQGPLSSATPLSLVPLHTEVCDWHEGKH